MNISYDVKVDALQIELIPGEHKVQTQQIDDDIALDFDELDRLVSIEVLDASRRLEMCYLFPVKVSGSFNGIEHAPHKTNTKSSDRSWKDLKHELLRRKETRTPVETLVKRSKNWVDQVAEEYVILRRHESGNLCKISRTEFLNSAEDNLKDRRKRAIVRALRDIASKL